MKKFIKNLILVILLSFTIIVIMNYGFVKLGGIYDEDCKKFENVPQRIQVCNLGSSHGFYDFDYSDINTNVCFNFALESQKISYDYRVLDYYRDNIEKNAKIFIPISYFSFFGNDEITEPDFESKNQRYYCFLDKEHIKNYSPQKEFFIKKFPICVASAASKYELIFNKHNDLKKDKIDFLKNSESAYKRHILDNYDIYGELIINNSEIQSLYNIFLLCDKIGAEPILIITPFTYEYNNIVDSNKEFIDIFNKELNNVLKMKNIKYYDYSHDTRFINNHEYFKDSDHLNEKGAKYFTDIVFKEVLNGNEK